MGEKPGVENERGWFEITVQTLIDLSCAVPVLTLDTRHVGSFSIQTGTQTLHRGGRIFSFIYYTCI